MNRYKATTILIVVTLGFLICFPFQSTFWGGLLSSGFCAAMIGGFADWYGVTALFRKPLGVPYRTEVIAKNRENIFNSLSKMVSEELLSKAFLKELIGEYDTSRLLIKHVLDGNYDIGAEKIVKVMLTDFVSGLDSDAAGNTLSSAAVQSLSQLKLSGILISAAELSMKNGYDDKIVDFIIDKSIFIMDTDDFYTMLLEMVNRIKASYESGHKRRALVNTVILDVFLQLSSESLTSVIKTKAVEYLRSLKDTSNINRLKFKQWIYTKFEEFKASPDNQSKFEAWITGHFNYSKTNEYITRLILGLKKNFIENQEGTEKTSEYLHILFDDIGYRFRNDLEWQKNVDEQFKLFLYKVIDGVHESIEIMVRDNLNKYTDKMLIDLIESKAGNDLQLIRINGSVVGGLVGMLIFLLTSWIK